MSLLVKKKCLPCIQGGNPLKGKELKALHEELGISWAIIEEKKLEKTFVFDNFKQALAFVNQVALIAEEEKHHPDFTLSWGKVRVDLWTHAIGGLCENDFILAAKIDVMFISKTGHL